MEVRCQGVYAHGGRRVRQPTRVGRQTKQTSAKCQSNGNTTMPQLNIACSILPDLKYTNIKLQIVLGRVSISARMNIPYCYSTGVRNTKRWIAALYTVHEH